MLSVQEALDFLLAATRPVEGTELISTLEANGRVLASAETSRIDVPPMDNTQMDGYAVRAADCVSGDATLTISRAMLASLYLQAPPPVSLRAH